MERYDLVVVGAGFAGSIMAYKAASELGKKVLVVEKRNHIAGNMYDFTDQYGIRIQKYGPHTFHTNLKKVYDFITQFCELGEYHLRCEAVLDGIATPSPFNFRTIDQFYPAEQAEALKKKLTERYGPTQATVLELLSCEDEEIRGYAEFLFHKDYSLYTAKQWGKKPEEIDPSVLRRVPVLFNYRDTYFSEQYEGVPHGGFTGIFERMLSHPNITVKLNTDALGRIELLGGEVAFEGRIIPVVFTGAIDELFKYQFGKLPYRSLWFDYRYYDRKDYQDAAIVAYPADAEVTRITEYTKLPCQNVGEKTVIALEYPLEYDKKAQKGNEPYYPVLTAESRKRYEQYKEYASGFRNLILCGRLADFKYYNMDAVIDCTLRKFESFRGSI